MTTQVVLVSTAFGLATVAAAYDGGIFDRSERRILVVTCNAPMPEATMPIRQIAGVPSLMSRFDAVFDYNACIEPLHPTVWRPRLADLPLWERYFGQAWDLGNDDLHLIVESIQVNPAQAICRIFGDARIDVYADGLMSYGPTRTALPEMVASRIERLLYLDLVPGLTPLLLSERQVPATVIPSESFRAVAKTMLANRAPFGDCDQFALIVGQYLAAEGLLSEDEELELYASMLSGCADAGYSSVAFKPHPSAPAGQLARLRDAASARGVRLILADHCELVEAQFERGGVGLVVGCFSTALLTSSQLYGLPTARLGTGLMLERLSPFQNSNRIPVTLVDALVPDLSLLTRPPEMPLRSADTNVNALVVAVGYAMQPRLLTARRGEAVAFLADHHESHSRYFKRRRLTRLGLPGSLPARPKPTLRRRLRRLIRRARAAAARRLPGAPLPMPQSDATPVLKRSS